MKLFKKLFLIFATVFCFSSFAVKDNYSSILKRDVSETRSFSEFESNMKKDFKEIVRDIAGKPVLVSVEEQEEEASQAPTPSSI